MCLAMLSILCVTWEMVQHLPTRYLPDSVYFYRETKKRSSIRKGTALYGTMQQDLDLMSLGAWWYS